MKKKLVAGMLATAMVASVFTGCGKKDDEKSTSAENKTSVEVTADDKGEIKLWVADNTVDFTKAQVDKFLEANPNYKGFSVTIEAVGEGDAATNMITDVTAGADIYGFAQDQLARLVSAGAIAPVNACADWIKENNDAGAAGAATIGGTTLHLITDTSYTMIRALSQILQHLKASSLIARRLVRVTTCRSTQDGMTQHSSSLQDVSLSTVSIQKESLILQISHMHQTKVLQL